jgi:hypothetical protein
MIFQPDAMHIAQHTAFSSMKSNGVTIALSLARRFQKFADVASHLPSRSRASAAKDFLVWIKANKK